jgi:hypothetical protein
MLIFSNNVRLVMELKGGIYAGCPFTAKVSRKDLPGFKKRFDEQNKSARILKVDVSKREAIILLKEKLLKVKDQIFRNIEEDLEMTQDRKEKSRRGFQEVLAAAGVE